MTGEQLRQLENKLWTAADQLRANSKLTASEYSFPVLGLIFLRHAYNRYKTARKEIEGTLPVHPQRGRRSLTKDDFIQAKALYLPEKARWNTIAELPEGEDIGQFIDDAMRSIEEEYEVLEGVLPKDYSIFEKQLLQRLVRIFNTEQLDDVTGDIFGRIYEYFLNKFALTGAQEGGEFFTPPSLVNAIVNVIEPDHGVVLDPACGSAGMFVQTGHFIEEEGFDPASKVTFYGQEKADTNTRLAKMNMTVHGLDAKIMQGNTFYEDQHDLIGKCDFVMANPPFNVDGVDKKRDAVKNDPRLPFGLPNPDNANYLWIQYFYSYLNETGRAGFVMASSASDAGHSEKKIRQKIVESGAVDVMISIGNKFFYTRSLPCTLWFFDRAQEIEPKKADSTLMLDLRDIYRKVSSNLHDFTLEHLKNIHAIVGLYRGNKDYFNETVHEYDKKRSEKLEVVRGAISALNRNEDINIEVDALDYSSMKAVKAKAHKEVKAYLIELDAAKEGMTKGAVNSMNAKKKEVEGLLKRFDKFIDEVKYFHKEYEWMTSRFPDGEYTDVLGLCKVVSQSEIKEQDYSLTPGRYVGVAPQIDENFDYEERMGEIKHELQKLNEESVELAQKIQNDLIEMGL